MEKVFPLILAIDTATPCSCVALTSGVAGRGGRVVASLSLTGSVSHSRRLLGALDFLLRETGVGLEEIDGIAVSHGPGSFTGLRIGMATAKGLAVAAHKPLYGVSSLDTLAVQCVSARLVCSVLDARKKEVYTALYRADERGVNRRVGEMAVLSPAGCAALIQEPVLMVGEGALLYRDEFAARLGDKFSLAPIQMHQVSAEPLGMLAAEKHLDGEELDLAACGPIYIRRSDAELNLLAQQKSTRPATDD